MTANEPPLTSWRVPGHDFVLAFGEGVLESLRYGVTTGALDGSTRQRGLLYGKFQDAKSGSPGCVTFAAPPLAADLAPNHRKAESTPGGSVLTGWYRLSANKNIRLTAEDRQYFEDSFPEPGSYALILRQTADCAIRVGVFFRESSGLLRWESSYQEFLVRPLAERTAEKTALPVQKTIAAPESAKPPSNGFLSFSGQTVRRWTTIGVMLGLAIIAALLLLGPLRKWRAAVLIPQIPGNATAQSGVVSNPSLYQKQLAEEKQKLEGELKARKAHDRRMEALVEVLRQRAEQAAHLPAEASPSSR